MTGYTIRRCEQLDLETFPETIEEELRPAVRQVVLEIECHIDFSAPTCCQSATFVRPFFAFHYPLFFMKKIINNAELHFMPRMNAVFALDVATALRQIRGRGCHRCGKGPCFYSTSGPTGSLLVFYIV